jgi:hypothetical protein
MRSILGLSDPIRCATATCAGDRLNPPFPCGRRALAWQLTTVVGMTFANVGTLGAVSGKRDELIALLTARNAALQPVGCLAYEVGVNGN